MATRCKRHLQVITRISCNYCLMKELTSTARCSKRHVCMIMRILCGYCLKEQIAIVQDTYLQAILRLANAEVKGHGAGGSNLKTDVSIIVLQH